MWLLLPSFLACIPFPKLSALEVTAGEASPYARPALRLVLAGDGGVEAGESRRGDPGLMPSLTLAMRQAAQAVPKGEVVWLGDNVYERGVEPGPGGVAAAETILAPQIVGSRPVCPIGISASIPVARG